MSQTSAEFVLKGSRVPKVVDVFPQMVSSRNTFSGRRVFAISSKQGGGSAIVRKDWNNSDSQKRRTTF
jgi:hypothetical protein